MVSRIAARYLARAACDVQCVKVRMEDRAPGFFRDGWETCVLAGDFWGRGERERRDLQGVN